MKKFMFAAMLQSLLLVTPAYSQLLDRDAIAKQIPDVEEGSLKPEDKRIICPFHRLMERAGLYDSSKTDGGPLMVTVAKITEVASKFGCYISGCASVTSLVSGGQIATGSTIFGSVNMEALHKSLGFSHECGLQFPKGSKVVTDAHRAETLRRLAALADANGHLTLDDLNTVKESICNDQGVKNNFVQQTEVRLMYTFLGGYERGFIDYSDIERFFRAELPKTIAKPNISLVP